MKTIRARIEKTVHASTVGSLKSLSHLEGKIGHVYMGKNFILTAADDDSFNDAVKALPFKIDPSQVETHK